MSSSARLRTRLLPLAAAPLVGALGVVEAWTDTGFRPHLGELSLVAGWLALAFVVQAFRPAIGAVLVAGFYPVTVALDAPGPGGTGSRPSCEPCSAWPCADRSCSGCCGS